MTTTDDFLRDTLHSTRIIALVGYSDNPERPSHRVAHFLAEAGYRVIPVNPGLAGKPFRDEVIRGSLADIPPEIPVDMLDIFRRAETVPELLEEALSALPHLRTVWMQLGITHEGAAARAREAGLAVVEDRCPKIEIARLFGTASPLSAHH